MNVDIPAQRRSRKQDIDHIVASGYDTLTSLILQEQENAVVKDRLVELARDWAQVTSEIALMRTEKQRSDALSVLTRVRDPVHDLIWPPLCKRHKGQYQTCPRDVWYIREHMEVAYWAIFLTVGGVYAVFLHGEYVVGNQLLLSVVLSRLLRVISFMTTTLPPPNPECRMHFSSAGDGGGCGDLLFSGHSTLVMTGICFVWSMDVPFRVPIVFRVLATLVGFHELATSAVEKMHYTVDIFLGIVVTGLVYVVFKNEHKIHHEIELHMSLLNL